MKIKGLLMGVSIANESIEYAKRDVKDYTFLLFDNSAIKTMTSVTVKEIKNGDIMGIGFKMNSMIEIEGEGEVSGDRFIAKSIKVDGVVHALTPNEDSEMPF